MSESHRDPAATSPLLSSLPLTSLVHPITHLPSLLLPVTVCNSHALTCPGLALTASYFFDRNQRCTMPVAEGTPQTLYDKVLQAHVVDEKLDGTVLLYIGQ